MDAMQILVIILSVFLAVFLALAIALTILLIRVTVRIRRIAVTTEATANYINKLTMSAVQFASPAFIIKLIKGIVGKFKK